MLLSKEKYIIKVQPNTFYAEFQEVLINDKESWLGKTQTVTKDYIGITDFNVLGEEGQELIAINYETVKKLFEGTCL